MNHAAQAPDPTQSSLLQRYRSQVDDPAAWAQALHRPLPPCLWVNPLKTTVAQFQQWAPTCPTLAAVTLEAIAWYPGAFRLRSTADLNIKPGLTLPFSAGWYYVQEEIALAAVAALDPQPGDRVLDLCAAPGGKTAQIATRLQRAGLVVANEATRSRLPSLAATISRLGLLNVALTYHDGRSAPFPPHGFDRVLVDAPCSGEGRSRHRPQRPAQWQPEQSLRMANLQRQLLDRALQWVKPGGTVVYSTCTYAPEENEAVLDAVVGDRAEFESAAIPGLVGHPGLTQWQGHQYRADLQATRRYWPHLNDTGGFFVAKLRRTDRQLDPQLGPTPAAIAPAPPIARDRLAQWCDRFGLSNQQFQADQLWQPTPATLWLHQELSSSDELATCGLSSPHLQLQGWGLPLVRRASKWDKPTTAALQRWGRHITQNVVELATAEQAIAFMQGITQPWPDHSPTATPGYVHVRYGVYELGCGLWRRGELVSQVPKTLRLAS